MNASQSVRRSLAARPTKYLWLVALTLITILVAGAYNPALASSAKDVDLPFGLQSGMTTAHLDKDGQFVGKLEITQVARPVDEKDLPFGLQSGLFTARGVGYQAPLSLAGGNGVRWGLQSGLVDASRVGYRAEVALVGGKGVPFGLESGLVTAHLQSDGLVLIH